MAPSRVRGPGRLWPFASAVWLLAVFLLLSGCASEEPDLSEPTSVPTDDSYVSEADVSAMDVPEFWVLGAEDFRTLTVSVEFPAGILEAARQGDIDTPYLTLRASLPNSGPASLTAMSDDGGAVTVDGADYAATTSGDVVPGDGVYAARISTGFADSEGEHLFEFLLSTTPLDALNPLDPGDYAVIGSTTVTVETNDPPIVESVDVPATLPSGFDSQTWTATVTEPNANSGDEVLDLVVELIPDGPVPGREFLFAPAGGNTWSYVADSSFSAGLASGDYTMRFTASDKFDQISAAVDQAVTIENLAPVIANLVSPDTVYQAATAEEPNLYTFTLDVSDQQSQSDIQTVYYTVTDPTGGYFESETFVFRDDGEDLDEVAGDGVWTHGFIVTESVSNFGTYIFRFYADDRGGNTSNEIAQEIELLANTEN